MLHFIPIKIPLKGKVKKKKPTGENLSLNGRKPIFNK